MVKKPNDQYTPDETKERMKAALLGARLAGHKPMESLTPKRGKAQPKKDPTKKK